MEKQNHKKVCVVLHLYYVDLWEYFLPYLKKIDTDIDLYVTITDNNNDYAEVHDKIVSEFSNSYIYSLPNRGMDIAPFLYVLNEINETKRQYDVLIKLHSKKSLAHSFELGERWRNDLTKSILGDLQKIHNAYLSCIGLEYKMVGSFNWVLNQKLVGYEQEYFSDTINFEEYEFVGGTMFMVDFNLLNIWFLNENIFERFYHKFEDGYIGDGSIAHHIERVLGCLVKMKGYKILKA